jgi:hypothetical protein
MKIKLQKILTAIAVIALFYLMLGADTLIEFIL